jgi:hypothetical protein
MLFLACLAKTTRALAQCSHRLHRTRHVAGKSYEAWVRKYWEKREKGEKNISIEPEALE